MKRSISIVSLSFLVALGYGVWFYQSSRIAAEENAEFKRAMQLGTQRKTSPSQPSSRVEFKVTPEKVISFDSDGGHRDVAFSPNSQFLAIGSNPIQVYETQNWKLARTIPGYGTLAFSPDSKLLATPNWDIKYKPGVGIWRLSDGSRLQSLNDNSGFSGAIGAWGPVAFSPDGRQVLTLGEDPNTAWRPGGGHNTEVDTIRDIALKTWDVSTGRRLKVLPGPSWGAGRDASVTWVRTSTRGSKRFQPQFFSRLNEFCQLPDRTLSVRFNGGLQLIIENLTTNQLIRRIVLGSRITAAALSPDGTFVASSGYSNGGGSRFATTNIHRVADGKLLAKFEEKCSSTSAITFSPDGKSLVVVGHRRTGYAGVVAVYAL